MFLFTEAMIQAHTLIQVICVYIDLIHLFIKKLDKKNIKKKNILATIDGSAEIH